jgi:hypothetical protein
MTAPKRVEDEDPPWFDDGLVASTDTDEVPWDRPADEPEPRPAPDWPEDPYAGPAPELGASPPANHPDQQNNDRSLRFGNPAAASWRQASRREAASLPAWADEFGADPYDEFAPLAADLTALPTASGPRHAVTHRAGGPESVFGDFFSLPADARPRRVSLPAASAQAAPAPIVAVTSEGPAGHEPTSAAVRDWPPVPTTFAPKSWESVTKPTTLWTGAAVTTMPAPAPPSKTPPAPNWSESVNSKVAPVEASAEEEDGPSNFMTVVLMIGTGIAVIGLVLAFLNFLTGVFR